MHISILWPWLFWGWTASEVALAIATHTRPSEGNTRDRGSMLLLWISIVAAITLADWTHNILPAATFSGKPWLQPLTVALLAAGLAIRWTAIVSLGKSFSVNVAIQKTQTVYRKGLYRLIRHPSYLGMLFIFLAIGLRTRNIVGVAVLLLIPTAALLYRIRIEETALANAFGAEYIAYCQTTKRLIPGLY